MNVYSVFLWGHPKKILMYASAVNTSVELLQRVQNGFTSVSNTPGIFQLIRQFMHRRAEVYLAVQAMYFLSIYFSPNKNCYLLS
jgi:hypothetical protein